ncbi:hypothetical protein FHS83_001613 [Rhizomicrobium palustre]|uniref:Lipoprotein n=1 Tax=Rhizomicrobium palustre TaxID=189966 RepID=A0A846MYK9_9PROT|nr:hypothetical protein [Rhizomicrobium palustre]NIK88295.1 hypothetical protein [Rhizomicrobium palustre]
MSAFARVSVAVGACLILAACQTPATYHPRDPQSGTGYTDEQLAANRYRVTFTGNSSTRREVVENYLLLRAAEVTLKAGYHWFIFDTRDTQAQTTYRSDFVGWPGWRGYGRYWHSWSGWGVGAGTDITTRPITSYEAFAEIVLLNQPEAMREPRAIKAEDVLEHIGPMARTPQP